MDVRDTAAVLRSAVTVNSIMIHFAAVFARTSSNSTGGKTSYQWSSFSCHESRVAAQSRSDSFEAGREVSYLPAGFQSADQPITGLGILLPDRGYARQHSVQPRLDNAAAQLAMP